MLPESTLFEIAQLSRREIRKGQRRRSWVQLNVSYSQVFINAAVKLTIRLVLLE